MPLLVLFLGWLVQRRGETRLSTGKLLAASIPFFLVSAAYVLLVRYYDPALTVIHWEYMPRKIMTAVGILLISTHPVAAEPVYTFFVGNKMVAVGAFAVLLSLGLLLWRRIRPEERRTVAGFVLLYVILLYPRIMYHASPRINTVQVLFVLLFLGWLATRLRPRLAW
jgi:hypothetical protein